MRGLARLVVLSALAASAALAAAGQDRTLTLDRALSLARQNNGTVRSAFLSYQASKASTRSAKAEFLPTLTPSATQEFARTDRRTGLLRGKSITDDLTSQVAFAWRLLDAGERRLSVNQAQASQEATEFQALQSLRRTLFNVHSRFYEALRTQELLKVQDRQVERARIIFEQTKFRASDPIGDAPRKDVKQAEADLLNSQVSQLSARTRIDTALANLKSVIGVGNDDLPVLEEGPNKQYEPLPFTLAEAMEEGVKNRADLAASRKDIDASKVRLQIAKLDTGPRWTVDANYRRAFSEDVLDSSNLALNIEYPLFDGSRSRERVNVQKFNLEASKENLRQNELDARAEIESAYKEYSQNLVRLTAASKALEAARENYEAAVESQKEGASTLVEVLTAQVTLTTAESNLVEARYDLILSEVSLRLSLGREMPGEKE